MSEFPEAFIKPSYIHLDNFIASIKAANSADIFILIISKNYGHINPGDLKSIMELEWEEAVKRDIPQIIFVEKEVDNYYLRYSKLKKDSRNEILETLKNMGYDNPEKLMGFLNSFIKLRKSKKRPDN